MSMLEGISLSKAGFVRLANCFRGWFLTTNRIKISTPQSLFMQRLENYLSMARVDVLLRAHEADRLL